jgi:hypothetical protein
MRGILANQREAEEGGGHHERFDRPYVSSPADVPGQIMTFVDGPASFITLNCKLGGVDEHGLIEDGPGGRGPDCGGASSPVSLYFLGDGRIDVDGMARNIDSILPIMGNRVVLEDLGEFFGGGASIGRLLVHLLGRDRGLNEDIELPRNPFDLDDLVCFWAQVFWRGTMAISTRCRHYSVGKPSSSGTRGGGPCRKCLANDGYMVYPSGDRECGLVRDLDDLNALESSSIKLLSSVACWRVCWIHMEG